jgi:hypothetical protein
MQFVLNMATNEFIFISSMSVLVWILCVKVQSVVAELERIRTAIEDQTAWMKNGGDDGGDDDEPPPDPEPVPEPEFGFIDGDE